MSGWQEARRNAGFSELFYRYVQWLTRRSFTRVSLRAGSTRLPSGGYVAVANHSSWWDGFVPFILHGLQCGTRPFAIMMSDRELRRFPFFRWAGAFSIDTSSTRVAYAAIEYAAREARAGAGVWIFPEGSLSTEPQAFTSGFVHAARLAEAPIVPVAMRFTMLREQRPEVFLDVAPSCDAFARDARRRVEHAVRDRLARIDRETSGGDTLSYVPMLRARAGTADRAAAAWRRLFE